MTAIRLLYSALYARPRKSHFYDGHRFYFSVMRLFERILSQILMKLKFRNLLNFGGHMANVANIKYKSRYVNIRVDFAIYLQIFASLVIVDLWSQSLQVLTFSDLLSLHDMACFPYHTMHNKRLIACCYLSQCEYDAEDVFVLSVDLILQRLDWS